MKVGDTLSLYCRASGLPDPTVKWYEGSQPVRSVVEQVLEVPTESPHTTVYTCIGSNRIGNRTSNITVIIEGTQ